MKCARIIARAGHSPARGRMTTRAAARVVSPSAPPRIAVPATATGYVEFLRGRDASHSSLASLHKNELRVPGAAHDGRERHRSTWLTISSACFFGWSPVTRALRPSPFSLPLRLPLTFAEGALYFGGTGLG